jgi:hypothetical protein
LFASLSFAIHHDVAAASESGAPKTFEVTGYYSTLPLNLSAVLRLVTSSWWCRHRH